MASHIPTLMIARLFQEVRSPSPCIFLVLTGQISASLCPPHSGSTVGSAGKEADIAAEPRELAEQCGVDAELWKKVVLSSAARSEEALSAFESDETGTVPDTPPGGASPGPGVRDWRGVVDLNTFDPTLPKTMLQFLEQGETTLSVARRALATQLPVLPRSQVTFLAPVTRPDKVVCVGMNYADHCKEQNVRVPKEPIIFSKFSSSIVGPYDEIILPPESEEVDWEVELAVIIGKKGKHIKATDAMAHVAGFTVAHDVSARDWQMRRNGKQWLLGKTFDTFCPLGPALVTRDSITDPHNLKICCRVNGEVVQSSSTNQMVFKTEELIAWVSQFVTLYPGDIILTGTPPGVGVFRKPPVFLKKGDEVQCEIEEIGVIVNKVV